AGAGRAVGLPDGGERPDWIVRRDRRGPRAVGSAGRGEIPAPAWPLHVRGAALVILSPFNAGRPFLGIWGVYAVYMAYKYALLWSAGFDWHDVFRQPRQRLFM